MQHEILKYGLHHKIKLATLKRLENSNLHTQTQDLELPS